MDKCKKRMLELSKEFQECKKAFTAIGDETRQHIIISLLESDCRGIRVGVHWTNKPIPLTKN